MLNRNCYQATFRNVSLAAYLLFIFVTASVLAAAERDLKHTETLSANVPAGAGSYTLIPPPGMKLPPKTIFKTKKITGPMQTTDWWSSLAWSPYSSNQFPQPLGCCATKKGLSVSYPGASINTVPKHIMASMQQELILGDSQCKNFSEALVDGFSDWFVTALFTSSNRGSSSNREMRVSYGHGSPFVYAIFQGGGAEIQFSGTPRVWSGSANSAVLGITIHGNHYGLFGPAGSSWSGLGSSVLVNHPKKKKYFSLGLLPDNQPLTLTLFKRYAYSHIVDTKVTWSYKPLKGLVETRFAFTTKPYEGREQGTLFALYPHQWKTTSTRLLNSSYSYKSVRGPMRIGVGQGFTTIMHFPGVLPVLPDKGKYDREQLKQYIHAAAKVRLPTPGDTYWYGKTLGTLVNLVSVADQIVGGKTAAGLRGQLKRKLETWFKVPASDNRQENYFYYNKNWGTLIGYKPSYGTADQLNDHHFHYGYFIRAAAEIARKDKHWASKNEWGGMVELLIRDIASPDRDDSLFPFLRCFDPYAGHSWASGNAKFGDGNNQESSSEAMNAWTGIILWGEATGNRKLRDLGVYLYTNEMYAINNYWFDIEDNLFPPGYKQTCAALIWGGKTDYATWFSAKPEHIHGINLLPIQSGSLYLGLYPDYVKRNLDGCASLRGDSNWEDWWDTLWCYEALTDADSAMRRFKAKPSRITTEEKPFVYHWIGNLQALGHVDRSVSANFPTAMVFIRNGRRTYIAFNMTGKPIKVRFSDGKTLRIQPNHSATIMDPRL